MPRSAQAAIWRTSCQSAEQAGPLSGNQGAAFGSPGLFQRQVAPASPRRGLSQARPLLCSSPEIADLSVERALEGWPSGAAIDVDRKAPITCNDVGMLTLGRGRIASADTASGKICSSLEVSCHSWLAEASGPTQWQSKGGFRVAPFVFPARCAEPGLAPGPPHARLHPRVIL
jgi:hypothetical protein